MRTTDLKRVRGSLAVALACAVACQPGPEPDNPEIYSIILATARKELDLPSPVLLHPLLAILDISRVPAEISMVRFNDFDSAAVPKIVHADPSAYQLCEPGAGGACRVERGRTAIVLSETIDMQRNGVGVVLMVTNHRETGPFLRFFSARVKRGLRTWDVVEFRQLGN